MPLPTLCATRLSLLLVAGSLLAAPPTKAFNDASQAFLQAQRPALGLDAQHSFAFKASLGDDLGQSHARFHQVYRGVRVWGGEAIVHTDAEGHQLPVTDALQRGITIDVEPSLVPAEALALCHKDLAPRGRYAYPPSCELVVYPRIEATPTFVTDADGSRRMEQREAVLGHTLAYHVRAILMNPGETSSTDYLVDAHTGAILKKWSSLQTTAVKGAGKSQFSGTVTLDTNQNGSTFELKDATRPVSGANTTYDCAHGTDNETTGVMTAVTLYTDADNAWGDGASYVPGGSTISANGQTHAVDAHYGLQVVWDMYKNVFNRYGIDGTGKATYSRVHYDTAYDNAFWMDECFCMTYGDGAPPSGSDGEADMDTVGHEVSHGLCAATANLTYSGESGGLNEASSDIFGALTEFYNYGAGATGSVIPDTGGNYTLFERSFGHGPLRWMYRPNLDGSSPNYWYSGMGSLDVHYSSGPLNRMFFFLAAGATTSGDTSTAINAAGHGVTSPNFLPNGMTGIGNQKAGQIWFRALSTYLTASSNYAAARTATIQAAKDLYGAGSAEEKAVWNAFHGINVGAAWVDPVVVTASITQPAADLTVTSGTSVDFVGSASTVNAGGITAQAWNFGDGGQATGAAASHVFTNTGTANTTYTVSYTATDAASAQATATRKVTVLYVGAPNTAPSVSAIANQTTPFQTPTAALAFTVGDAETPAGSLAVEAHASNPALIPDANLVLGGAGANRTLTVTPAQGQSGTATLTLTVTDGGGLATSTTFTLTVGADPSQQPVLIISQYYEGTGSNKWIEVTNIGRGQYDSATSAKVYLGQWNNPRTTNAYKTPLLVSGTLAPGASKLIANSSATLPSYALSAAGLITDNNVMTFNGNDVMFLTTDATASAASYAARIDAIGSYTASDTTLANWDPATLPAISGFAANCMVGQDRSFVRKATVLQPNATFTLAEWTQLDSTQITSSNPGLAATAQPTDTNYLGYHAYGAEAATVTGVTVSPAPTYVTTGRQAQFTATVTGTGAYSPAVAWSASRGTVSATGLYTAPATSGADTVTATSAADGTKTGSVTFTVTAPPAAVAQTLTLDQDTSLPITLAGSDEAGRTLTYTVASQPAHGTLSGAAPSLSYTPAAGFAGADSFTFTVSNGDASSAPATVAITVNPVNHAPVATPASLQVAMDGSASVTLAGTDPDGQSLTYAVVTAPAHGSLAGAAPNLTYTPAAGYAGPDSFTFKASDGTLDSAPATIAITVTAVNRAPVATPGSLQVAMGGSAAVTLAGSDPDGQSLTYAVVTAPAHGSLAGAAPNLTYTPAPGYFGPDSFTFKASDGALDSAPATVAITVVPPSVAGADLSLGTLATRTVTGTLRAAGGAGSYTYSVATQPAQGALTLGADGAFTYVPAPGATGTDSFVWQVRDQAGQTATARVTVKFNTFNQDTDTAVVDGADLLHVVRALGSTDPAFDFNGDGKVDDADLTLFIAEIKR